MAKRSKSANSAPVAVLPGMSADQTAEALASVAPVAPVADVVASDVVASDVVAPVADDSAKPIIVLIQEGLASPLPTPPAPVAPPADVVAPSVAPVASDVVAPPADSAPVAPDAPNVPTPPAPVAPPCVAVSPHVDDSAKPDALLTAKAHALCVAFIAFVGDALNVGTERMAQWGERVRDILLAELNATEGWDSKSFDSTMTNIATEFARANPDALPLRAADAWKVAEFRTHCVKLGIPDVERISAKRITNALFPAGFVMVKTEGTSTVRDGWADWIKHVVPIVARGEMNDATLGASVELQRSALNASDPKRFPLKNATGAKSRKETKGSGRKAPKVAPVKPTPAPVKPTPAPVAPVKPTPAPSVAPVAPVAVNIPDVVKGLSVATATALGNALLTHPDDDVLRAIYKAILPRMKLISAKDAASKASA